MMSLKGKTGLVTGASSGIGEAVAREFARRGMNVVLLARRTERLKAVAADLEKQGVKVLALHCDVTLDGQLEEVVRRTVEAFGSLDFVVANAGFGVTGKVSDLSLQDFRRQFETNIYGVLRTIHAAGPALKQTGGRIAVLGSVMGYASLAGISPYSMSKFAVRALCDALYLEWRAEGVSVTHVAPGFVRSEIRRVTNAGTFDPGVEDAVPMWVQMTASLAAKKIVRAMIGRRREIVLTGHGKIGVFLARHFPNVTAWLLYRLSWDRNRNPRH